MANYKIQELLKSGFDFNSIFIEKQDELRKHSGFNFGLQEIALLISKQTDDFTKDIPVAHDIDDALNGVYLKWKKTQQPEEPKEEKKKTVEDFEKLIKGYSIKLKGAKTKEDKEWISKKIKGYEIKIKSLKTKKEKGGEMVIETQHTFGDPKENTDPKIDLSFSAQDPKKEYGGGLDTIIKIRNLENGKVSNWTIEELLERINEDNAPTASNNYDKSDWVEGFNETLVEFYSLNDKNGKPLNDLSKYAKGGVMNDYQEEAIEVGGKVAQKING